MSKSILAIAGILLVVAGGAIGWFAAQHSARTSEQSALQRKKDQSLEIFQAAEQGQASRIVQLLASGAGVNDKDPEGETALMKAAANNHVAVLRALFDKQADLDERDKDGEDALMKAAAKGHLAAVQILLSAGRELMLSAQDRNGMTALMKAAANGQVLVVKEMVNFVSFPFEHRYNVGAKDLKGKTALDHAREKGHQEIIALLEPKKKSP